VTTLAPFARLAAVLALAVVVVVVTLAVAPGSPAQAKLAPALTITAGDPNAPVEVPPPPAGPDDPDGAILNYDIAVAGGPATNVTVSVTGVGLNITYFLGVGQMVPGPVNLGTVNSDVLNYVSVSAATGGFHQLTFTVTADGAAPASTTLNYVWAPTGAMTVSPTQDLRSTYFVTTGTYSENDTSYDDRAELLFLDADTAYYGIPVAGLPTCKTGSVTATSGCLAYAYDASTRLIQIGGSIGRVDGYGVHTIGLGVTDVQGGDSFPHRDWLTRLQFPDGHHRYAGSWSLHHKSCSKCLRSTLTLRKDGTFTLSDNYQRSRTFSGRYDISHHGRLTLTGKEVGRTGKEVHTFSVLLSDEGKPAPRSGVTLTYGTRKRPDLVFLIPTKK
jgi:hypothetical protein